jgi:uncharacterized membrane protein
MDSPAPRQPLPLTPTRIVLGLVGALLFVLIEAGTLEFVYARLGVSHRYFFALLALSLPGSLLNVPLFTVAPRPAGESVRPTLVAINVGGALVPSGLALWVLARQADPTPCLLALVLVTLITWSLAKPLKGVGIAMPMLVPPLAAAAVALFIAPATPAATAYVGGTLGALLGADVLNLAKIGALGAPVVSIGGAGTLDGVFLTGLLAVLLAVA